MQKLAAAEKIRSAEIAAITATADPADPTVIVGDFNSVSTQIAPQHLRDLGYIDAFASVHENADAHPTWHWPTRPLPIALRIDYIFHSPHFVATEARVIQRDGSDHALVVAQLEPAEAPE